MSNQTRQPTHPPNQAREPSDPKLATVGGGSPIPKPETGGLVDKLKHGKSIFNWPNRETHWK